MAQSATVAQQNLEKKTDVNVEKELLIAIAQQIGICRISDFVRYYTLQILAFNFVEAVRLR